VTLPPPLPSPQKDRAEDTELGRRLAAGGGSLHVVGKLKADDWNGRQGVQFEIEDAADPRMSA